MGKARIITDHGEGLYTIELLEDRARATKNRAVAVSEIASIDGRLAALQTELNAAQAEVNSAANALDIAIGMYQADPTPELREEMRKASETAIEAGAKRNAIERQMRELKVRKLAYEQQITRIDSLPALRQQQAWCADLTEQITGEVGTAEVPNQPQKVIIHPGHEGAAVHDPARDGALQPALAGTPASVFYNLAMLPGWQKWRPTYRTATISNISIANDTCTITLDPATSSEQGLDVNVESSYADVPIQYMTCHANAFDSGDKVLVRFDTVGLTPAPTVIGFESAPKGCGIDTIVAVPVTLHFNDSFPFIIGGPCGCGEPVITQYSNYTARNVVDFCWSLGFGYFNSALKVFYEANVEQVLNASDYSGWPAPDETLTQQADAIVSFHRTPPRYSYQFPTGGLDPSSCGYITDSFSRIGVTDSSPEIGGGPPWFGGDLIMYENGGQAFLNLNGTAYEYTTTPALRQPEYNSADTGVYKIADDGTGDNCTAGYMLSKEREVNYAAAPIFTLGTYGMSSQRPLPTLTIDGKEKRPLGVFGMVPGENTWKVETFYHTFTFTREFFNLKHENKYYLLVGYGR